MTHYAGLDVSQKETTICVVDEQGRRLWRGTAPTDPEALTEILRQHGCDLRIGVETGPLMPWLVHGLRRNGLEVICLDARHAKAALAMQFNKNDRDDAEGLAQIVRTGWYPLMQGSARSPRQRRCAACARIGVFGCRVSRSAIRRAHTTAGLCCRPAGERVLWSVNIALGPPGSRPAGSGLSDPAPPDPDPGASGSSRSALRLTQGQAEHRS